MIQQPSSTRSLALNTWIISFLRGDRPGGVPNDFLTHGSAALLVFDEVLCDADALESEAIFRGTWLSSDILLQLQKDGILRAIRFQDYLPSAFLAHLTADGYVEAAMRMMDAELRTMLNGSAIGQNMRLPEALTLLNHYMFMGLELPNTLLYEFQEHHFKVMPRAPSGSDSQAAEKSRTNRVRMDNLGSVLKAVLPQFQLLPPISSEGAKAALRKNIADETPALYRWIYGDPDMPREKYHELRLRSDFRHRDFLVDDPRRAQANENYERLLTVRARTKDVRAGVQRIVGDVVDGRRTARDVQNELAAHQLELQSHLATEHSMKVDVALSRTSGIVSVAEGLASVLGGVFSPVGLGLSGLSYWKARQQQETQRQHRQRYPLAWFLREFNDVSHLRRERLIRTIGTRRR